MQLQLTHHDIVDGSDTEIDNDLLSPNASDIRIRKTDRVPEAGFIHLSGDFIFDGLIDSVSQEEDETVISVKPLLCLFDTKVILNAAWQKKDTNMLESAIEAIIKSHWIENTDTLENLPVKVVVASETSNWTLDVEAGSNGTYKIINFLTEMIEPAFERYGIVTNGQIDFTEKKVVFTIGKIEDSIIIDADLPMITIVEFVRDKFDGDMNKLRIMNNSNYSQSATYYLHPDGTYNTTDENRLTPVKTDYVEVSIQGGSTFAASAADQAESVFGKYKYKNYVEFETQLNDGLVRPYEIKIGTKASIYHDGSKVETMLTGIKFGEQATLMFGTVRFDYTKRT